MRRSDALLATSHEAPDAGTAVVAQMRRAGLLRQFGSGLYGFAPTGERVRRKIVARIESAMAAVGAQRVDLPALQYSDDWRASGRWANFEDEMFTLTNRDGQTMCLVPSHEEGAVRLLDGAIRSHDDLPVTVYQTARKYRDDHARNGLVRCKEFGMKDAYSVHIDRSSLDETYARMREAYVDTFDDLGLDVAVVPADNSVMGGTDSEEFVAPVAEGSDRLVACRSCRIGRTDEHAEFEHFEDGDNCPDCGGTLRHTAGIEVGHIFKLGTRYAEAMGLTVDGPDGEQITPTMGSYGIGVTRVLQTLPQQHAHGEEGCRWPVTAWGSVAPYRGAIVPLEYDGDIQVVADRIYESCGDDVLLFDDRSQSIGERFAESGLLGIPATVVIGNHYRETGDVEIEYGDGTTESVGPDAIPGLLEQFAAGKC